MLFVWYIRFDSYNLSRVIAPVLVWQMSILNRCFHEGACMGEGVCHACVLPGNISKPVQDGKGGV